MWVIVVLAFILVIFLVAKGGKDEVEFETEVVAVKDIFQTVSVTGELKAKEEIKLNFETTGRVKSISAYVGKKMAEGETVAIVDGKNLSEELNRADAALSRAIAQAGANDDAIREAEQTADDAKDYLEYVEEYEDQKVDAADQSYEDADNYYDDAVIYYDQVVSDSGAGSAEAKLAKLTLRTAEDKKNAAEEAKSTVRKSRDVSVASAESSYNSAKERLETAKSNFTKRASDADVASARAAYNIALANLDKATLKAPVNGTITEVNYEKGEVISSAGTTGNFGKIMSSDFILEVDIPESDIDKIELNQVAIITFDAFSDDEEFEAEIVEIEPAATVIQDVVYYKAKLRLDALDNRLKPGMSADVDIQTNEKKGVTAVSSRAVKNIDGKKQVKVVTNEETNEAEMREVQVGLKGDEGDIQILSGLSDGEIVVTIEKNKKDKK